MQAQSPTKFDTPNKLRLASLPASSVPSGPACVMMLNACTMEDDGTPRHYGWRFWLPGIHRMRVLYAVLRGLVRERTAYLSLSDERFINSTLSGTYMNEASLFGGIMDPGEI